VVHAATVLFGLFAQWTADTKYVLLVTLSNGQKLSLLKEKNISPVREKILPFKD
jgi:hypothetical protein